MKVLNIGAGGFIGAHLTQRLLSRGHTVVGVDTHTDKVAEFVKSKELEGEIVKGKFINNVTVTAPAEKLAKAVSTKGAKAFIDKDCEIRFKRAEE